MDISFNLNRFLIYFLSVLFFHPIFLPKTNAEDSVTVEYVQAPAWVKDNNSLKALYPGQTLKQEQQVITGNSGKTVLKLSEGSAIKLGENSTFVINSIHDSQSNSDVFNAAFKVLKGAFRFTTRVFSPNAYKRNIKIATTTATIGIRGTDLWGRVKAQEDLVALLEGEISINRVNEDAILMTEPLSVYTAKINEAANPLSTVDMNTVNQLALETELDSGKGIITQDGPYTVFVASSNKLEASERLKAQYISKGFPATITEIDINDTAWYRVGVSGYKTYADAVYFSDLSKTEFNSVNPWINKN